MEIFSFYFLTRLFNNYFSFLKKDKNLIAGYIKNRNAV